MISFLNSRCKVTKIGRELPLSSEDNRQVFADLYRFLFFLAIFMKLRLVVVGKTSTGYLKEGINEFTKRVSRYFPFEIIELPDLKSTKGLTAEKQKQREGELILNAVGDSGAWVTLLDEHGKEFTSRGFAEYIDKRISTLNKDIIFVVGGPYGFSPAVYERADDKISLSKMTLTHEMIRLMFTEQLYRAFTILHGEPYHHD